MNQKETCDVSWINTEGLENLTHTGHFKRIRGRQQTTYWTRLCEWIAEREVRGVAMGETMVRVANGRKLGRAMIDQALKRHDT